MPTHANNPDTGSPPAASRQHNTRRTRRRVHGIAVVTTVSYLAPPQGLVSPLVWAPVFSRLGVLTLFKAFRK